MTTKRYFKAVLLLILMGIVANQSFATIWFVAPATVGTGTGASWANAKAYSALTVTSGDVVYMLEGNSYIGKTLVNGITFQLYIKGSYPSTATGTDTSGFDPVNHPTSVTNDYTMIQTASSSHPNQIYVIGFTFIQGTRTGVDPCIQFLSAATANNIFVVDKCNFNNLTNASGVTAIYVENVNSAVNTAYLNIVHITNCVVNGAVNGGGPPISINDERCNPSNNGNLLISNVSINNCGGLAGTKNRGIVLAQVNYMTIQNSVFCSNNVGGGVNGYGALFINGASNGCIGTIINNNIFNNNLAPNTNSGGAITIVNTTSTTISNNIFYGNTSGNSGTPTTQGADIRTDGRTTLTGNTLQLPYTTTNYPNTTNGGGNTTGAANPGSCPNFSSVAMPIKVTNFSGVKTNAGNLLTWNWYGSNELAFSHFELQRSSGNGFSTIASLPLNNSGSYAQADASTVWTNYYRLAQFSLDGSVQYSNILAIVGNTSSFNVASVYPMPATSTLKVLLYSPTNTIVTYTITDMRGRVISQQQNNANDATTQAIDVSRLVRGYYIITVDAAGTRITKKFTKL